MPTPPPQQEPAATVAPTLPAATAHPTATVPIKQEGNPAHCGVKYDEVHGSASKNITKVVTQWPGTQKKHELTVLKVQDHPMVKGGMPLQEVQRMLVMCSNKFSHIEKVHMEMQLQTNWRKHRNAAKTSGSWTSPSRVTWRLSTKMPPFPSFQMLGLKADQSGCNSLCRPAPPGTSTTKAEGP